VQGVGELAAGAAVAAGVHDAVAFGGGVEGVGRAVVELEVLALEEWLVAVGAEFVQGGADPFFTCAAVLVEVGAVAFGLALLGAVFGAASSVGWVGAAVDGADPQGHRVRGFLGWKPRPMRLFRLGGMAVHGW
jgi:hypothetical protein